MKSTTHYWHYNPAEASVCRSLLRNLLQRGFLNYVIITLYKDQLCILEGFTEDSGFDISTVSKSIIACSFKCRGRSWSMNGPTAQKGSSHDIKHDQRDGSLEPTDGMCRRNCHSSFSTDSTAHYHYGNQDEVLLYPGSSS